MDYSVIPQNSFKYTTNFANKHIQSYRYDVRELNDNYVEMIDEKVRYQMETRNIGLATVFVQVKVIVIMT